MHPVNSRLCLDLNGIQIMSLARRMGGSQSELVEWTAQSSAPVMVWNDERPRALWNDQLYLAERLQPEPSLIPAAPEDRVRMFGLANELMGEGGLLFHKRHFMAGPFVDSLPEDSPARTLMSFLGQKYGYNEQALVRATGRIVGVRADGDLDIAFDRIETENLSVHPREIAPAPALTPRAFLGLRIFSH